jgi:hypothetical protein
VSRVDRVLKAATRKGARDGLGEGSRFWLSVGAVAAVIRVLRWMGGPGKPTVVTEELAPGETIVIRHIPHGGT